MLSKIISAILLAPILLVLAYFHHLWFAIILIALVLGFVISLRASGTWMKPALFIMGTLALCLAFCTGWVPRPKTASSITANKFFIHGKPLPDTTPPVNQAQDLRESFEEEYYLPLQTRAAAVEQAPELETRAREVLIRVREKGKKVMATELDEAIQHLHESIQGQDLQKHSQQVASLLEASRKELDKLQDPRAISKALARFHQQYKKISIDNIYENVTEVEAALNKLIEETAAGLVRSRNELRAHLDEARSRLELSEKIVLLSQVPIREIESEDLQLDYLARGLKPEIFVAYDDCQAWTPLQVSQLRRDQRTVCLALRTAISTPVSPLPTGLRIPDFQSFDFSWPPLQPVRLHALLDLSSLGLPNRSPYTLVLQRDGKISDIRVPKASYFYSKVPFEVQPSGAEDRIVPKEEIHTSYFADHEPVQIELMPRSPLFRNALVQSKKEYLLSENLFFALVLACVCALFGAALPTSKP